MTTHPTPVTTFEVRLPIADKFSLELFVDRDIGRITWGVLVEELADSVNRSVICFHPSLEDKRTILDRVGDGGFRSALPLANFYSVVRSLWPLNSLQMLL